MNQKLSLAIEPVKPLEYLVVKRKKVLLVRVVLLEVCGYREIR
jgi:hypothetical protein